MTPHVNLQEWFGQIDIYLFDQLLKGCLPNYHEQVEGYRQRERADG